jgi:2,3-bisphosphoglycerate-dependent phosphoglycerate mutase
MKKALLVLLFLASLTSFAQEVTTYYLVRHAEKDRTDKTNSNPELTQKGMQRAVQWSQAFEYVDFDAVYSTNYKRTVSTAKPTAVAKDLEVQFYNPRQPYSVDFRKATSGKTVLVVGHSNTTPQFVNAIIREKKYPQIQDDNNSNLYVVTLVNNSITSIVLKID